MAFNYNQEFITSGLNYSTYRDLINETLNYPAHNEASEKMRPYIEKNVALMDEFDRTYQVSDQLKITLAVAPATTWIVITEGWCGDAAFNIPMMAALEKSVPGKINLCFYLRDSNLELIDANLTDGGRSIPKVIVLNQDMQEIGTWGPRPAGLQVLMKEWKNNGLALKEIIPKVNAWYDTDGTKSLQNELIALIISYT